MANIRQLMIYLGANSNLTGVNSVTGRQAWGKSRVTLGMTRRSAVPAKNRNGAGRTSEESGEFVPGLGGLS